MSENKPVSNFRRIVWNKISMRIPIGIKTSEEKNPERAKSQEKCL